ncbi:MAG: endonuclease/exonuclease/phosphatase family protein [Anaerolineae bacterium]|nr:endonuclease/exonuclease/phosphatase family protein [Anaerolineae bacterium]
MTQQTNSIAPQTRLQYIAGIFYFAFRALVGAYALTVFLSLLVHFFLDETVSDVVALTNSMIHFTTLGAIILLPITLMLRRRDLALMLLPSAIFWLAWAIPQFLPKNIPQTPPDATEITVLTYNLLARMEYPDDIRRIITEADADIVVLQELNALTAEMLQRDMRDDYRYMELHPGGIPGVGIISRYELSDCILWEEVFQHQRCEVIIGDETVILYNVHPMSPLTVDGFNRRRRDLASILARISADVDAGLTIIAAGDWNMTPLSDGYAQMREYLNDSYADVGQGLGFTYRLHNLGRFPLLGGEGVPVVRIDYVFYTAPLIAQEAQVWHENGLSDHIPLWVRLALP